MNIERDEDTGKIKRVWFDRDEEDGIINPPTLPEYERRMSALQAQGDVGAIQALQEEYDAARVEEVDRLEAIGTKDDDDGAAKKTAKKTTKKKVTA